MSTENISVAWVEAAKEITVKVLDKMDSDEVSPDVAAETYKTIYQAVFDASTRK